MIFFHHKTKNITAITPTLIQNKFYLSRKNAWLLWFCQCLNLAIISVELSSWILAVIALSLAWQALLLNKSTQAVQSGYQQKKSINASLFKVSFFKRNDLEGNSFKDDIFKGDSVKGHALKDHSLKDKVSNNNASPFILAIFALLGCLAIAVTAKQVGILGSMLHLLCFSYALKAFELKARSDFYQLLLLGIFVLASALIFRQDLVFSLIILSLLVINLAVLLQFFSIEKAFATDIKIVTILLGQSAVLAVVLFLVFPRLSPFWQMPTAKSAETGLSDTVKPGDIANLTRSTKLAFRADFGQEAIPNYSQLYWRAMVLENYDGRQWTRKLKPLGDSKPFVFQPNTATNTTNTNKVGILPSTYQVTVEPSFQKYLFALAPAVSLNNNQGIQAKDDYTFTSSKIITQAKSYQLSSYLSAPLALELSSKSRALNLSYPQGSNPRLEKMALQLQQDYPDPQARAKAVLLLINKQNYSYTLQPPRLSNNSLDQFFFDTQAGFCVHYASAFTFIMRASGVPARLVTGYLGGEYNGTRTDANNERDNNDVDTPLNQYSDVSSNVNSYINADTSGLSSDSITNLNARSNTNFNVRSNNGHLSIYQYDAHAWSEIWVEGKGWIRIDATGAVDPERVNSGWSNDLLKQQATLNNELVSLYQFKNITWLNSLRLQFDALDYQWTRWVIGFTAKQQYDLFQQWFGKMVSWKLAVIVTVSLVGSMTMLMLLLHLFNRSTQIRQPLTSWQRVYNKALSQLAKQGIDKPLAMTTNDFAQKIRAQHPELAIVFTRLSLSYNALCYQVLTSDEQAKLILTIQQQYKDFTKTLKKHR